MANDINTLSAGATVTGAEVTKDGDLMVSIRDDQTGLQTPIYVKWITSNRMTLLDVPSIWREEVQKEMQRA